MTNQETSQVEIAHLLSLLGDQYEYLRKIAEETFRTLGKEQAGHYNSLANDWIEILTTHLLKDKNIVAVTGPCKFTGCPKTTHAFVNFIQPNAMRFYRLIFGYFWLSGFNFGIKKSAYLKSGGFNLNLNGLEDIELSLKVSKIGKIKFIGNLPVVCSGRRFIKRPLAGLLSYIKTFIKCFYLGNRNIYLSDIR